VERLRKTLLACGAGVFVSLTALNSIDAPEYGVERQQYDGRGTVVTWASYIEFRV
jgi:hypothetical protein